MKIVVLDGYTLNPGDLSWDWLHDFGDVVIYDRTAPSQIPERAVDADILFTNKTVLDGALLRQLPSLRYIGVLATGYNIVDTAAAREKGILVTNAPAYGTASVVQMTFALLLELCMHVQRHSDSVFQGKWARCPDFCYTEFPLVGLNGKTLGIVGFGDIGKKVGSVAAALGMNVLVTGRPGRPDPESRADLLSRPHPENRPARESLSPPTAAESLPAADIQAGRQASLSPQPAVEAQPAYPFRRVSLEELLASSDVVSLHCPLTPGNRGLIDSDRLRSMKPSAFLVNTSRGPLIVEEDLRAALNEGVIAGAALDVLSGEPPRDGNPLFSANNCIITPHIAWATREARGRLMDITRANLAAFAAGHPVNIVNP